MMMVTTVMMMEISEQVGAGPLPAFLLSQVSRGRKRPEVRPQQGPRTAGLPDLSFWFGHRAQQRSLGHAGGRRGRRCPRSLWVVAGSLLAQQLWGRK